MKPIETAAAPRFWRFVPWFLFAFAALSTTGQAAPDYERDIKPMLQQRCYSCHSRLKQKAELRLDAGALIHRGGKHGSALVVSNSSESLLLQRILETDPEERMPPEGKPLTPEQTALLKSWIDGGAQYPPGEVIPPTPAEHWAFQPVRRPALPVARDQPRSQHPIDRFIFTALEARDLRPAPPAEPRALLRRVYLDLIGLPPTLAEQDAFLKAPSAEAFAQVIDDLLRRPAYGERWARHWLDVVRFAESNGYERDAEKPFAWRYRDYVINAFNADKPFDRFIVEQLAGDELPDATAETMIATGFHRLGHWDDEPSDPTADRFDQLDDIVSTTSQAFLGLTLGCARCHDHKFEPLSTRDYYSMVAVFNPLQRPQNGRTELTLPAGSRQELAALSERDQAIARVQQQTNALVPAAIAEAVRKLREVTPDLPQAYFLREASPKPPVTHVLLRGSPTRPGEEVPPAVPAVLVKQQPAFPPGERTTQRRLALARWLASADHPLTARVMVNRVWQHHFGYGLVRTPNDFGLMGERPTHPELLDWLADWFARDAQWSVKKLHRLILTSATWGQSSVISKSVGRGAKSGTGSLTTDPLITDSLLPRFPHRRLEVEAIRDSMLAVSGQLNLKMGGPSMKPRIPLAALEANTDKESIWKPSDDTEASRRTIYAFIKRGLVVPLLEVLDLGDTVNSCPQRQVTTVAPQALSLFNGEFVNAQAAHFATRLAKEVGTDPAQQIDLAYRLALARPPSSIEMAKLRKFLKQEAAAHLADAAQAARPCSADEAHRAALIQTCRAILNLNEFVYAE